MTDSTLPAGPEGHPPGRLATVALRALDGILHGVQGLRNRIAPPMEEEDRRGRAGRPPAHRQEEPPAVVAPPAHSGHLHAVLVFVLAMAIGGVGGMLFSYKGLSRIVATQELMIDDLRDQIAQLEKEEARSLSTRLRYQKEANELEKELRATREEIQEYKEHIEEMEARLAALKPPERPAVSRGGFARPAPQKTGTCAMDSANPAALADCIERYNRK